MPESIKPESELESITNTVEVITLENLRNGNYSKNVVKNLIEEKERGAKYMESGNDAEMRQKLINGGFPARLKAEAQGYRNALEKFESKK